MVAIIAADFTTAQAQNDDETAGRIVARLLDDGRVEFGWQPVGGARVLPTKRYFPASIDHNRWLRSSPVEVGGAEIGRINARQSDDGRIEFAFTPTGGQRIQPSVRHFPVNARPNRWLRSTELRIPTSTGYIDDGSLPVDRKHAIVAALYGYSEGQDVEALTNHDYNDFGAHRDTRCGYRGGHSGWDVQTKSVSPGNGGNRLVNVPFYSLTAGKVIEVGVDGYDNTIIAVHDGEKTTLYLHARLIEVPEGAKVRVGTRLGIQGMAGMAEGVHVHLEVRDGPKTRAACGAPGSIDPVNDDYLWRSVTNAWPVTTSVVPEIARFRGGDRIRAKGAIDQYVVKQVGERRFKRLILNLDVLKAYGWETIPETEIEAEVLNAIPTSTLVWVADAQGVVSHGAKVWHLRSDGDRGTRHHVTAEVFAAAGLDWESVFTISSAEAAFWREGGRLNHNDARELRQAQGYRD